VGCEGDGGDLKSIGGVRVAEWWPHLPLTQSVEYWFADQMLVGDQAVFTVWIDRIQMPSSYFEVDYGTVPWADGGAHALIGDGGLQYYDPGQISSPGAGGGAVAQPAPGDVWVPITAQINVATGAAAGDREASIFFQRADGGPDLDAGIPLAHTLTLKMSDTQNNNTTGTYSVDGTGPHDSDVQGHHVDYAAGIRVTSDDGCYVAFDGQPGDTGGFRLILLAMPATGTFPPPAADAGP
jgi:hypothetical protein